MDKVRINRIENRRRRRIRRIKAYAARGIFLLMAGLLVFFMVRGTMHVVQLFAGEPEPQYNENVPVNRVAKPDSGSTETNWGKLVVIDAGHGGKDEGTANGGEKEKDIVLSLALMIEDELSQRGINVLLTRREDEFLNLSERTEIANAAGADLFLSVHVDSYFEDTSIHGMTCHYKQGSSEGSSFASVLSQTLQADGYSLRNSLASDLYVLNHTKMPAVLLETGFISNSADFSNLSDEEYLRSLAESIADGIVKVMENEGDLI